MSGYLFIGGPAAGRRLDVAGAPPSVTLPVGGGSSTRPPFDAIRYNRETFKGLDGRTTHCYVVHGVEPMAELCRAYEAHHAWGNGRVL